MQETSFSILANRKRIEPDVIDIFQKNSLILQQKFFKNYFVALGCTILNIFTIGKRQKCVERENTLKKCIKYTHNKLFSS